MAESHRDEISKLEALYSDNPEGRVFTLLAEAYRKAGELDRARQVLDGGLKRHSGYASAYVVLGRVLLDLQQGDDAEDAFKRVLTLDPENLVALRALGDRARSTGRTSDAIGYYRELLQLDPSDDDLQTAVASLEADLSSQAAATPAPDLRPASRPTQEFVPREPQFGDVTLDDAPTMPEESQTSGGFGNISFAAESSIGDAEFKDDVLDLGAAARDLTMDGSEFGSLSLGGDDPPAGGGFDLGGMDLGDAAATGASDFGLPDFGDPAAGLPGFDGPGADLPGFDDPGADMSGFGSVAEQPTDRIEPLEDASAGLAELPLVESPFAPSEPELEQAVEASESYAGSGMPADVNADAFPFTADGETTPEIPSLDAWSPDTDADVGALAAAAAGPEPWVVEDEAGVSGEVVTETMAELYRSQGLNGRSAEVYRALLRERPGDAQLEARLAEAEAAAAAAEPEHGPTAWTEANTAVVAGESLYGWTAEEAPEENDAGPAISEYFRGLLAWRPAQPAYRPAATGVTSGSAAARRAPVEPPTSEASAGVTQSDGASMFDVLPAAGGLGGLFADDDAAADGSDSAIAGASPEGLDSPFGDEQSDSGLGSPFGEDAAEAGLGSPFGDEYTGAPPKAQPAAAPSQPASPPAPLAEGDDDLAWLFDDEPAAAAAPPEAAPKSGAPAPEGSAAPAGNAAQPGDADAEDDDDLDMFRSWLQSLKR